MKGRGQGGVAMVGVVKERAWLQAGTELGVGQASTTGRAALPSAAREGVAKGRGVVDGRVWPRKGAWVGTWLGKVGESKDGQG